MAYTTHYVYSLTDDRVWWEVRNRNRFVCRCETEHMANRIRRALSAL